MASSPFGKEMQATSFVLADAAGTPVNHTFVPNGKDDKGTFWYVDRSQANAIGYWKVSVEFKEPASDLKPGSNSKDRNYRIRLGLHEPVMEVLGNNTVSGISPSPTVAYIPRMYIETIVSERSSTLERQHLTKMGASLLAIPQIKATIDNFDKIYG
jgi:hypothetical protein